MVVESASTLTARQAASDPRNPDSGAQPVAGSAPVTGWVTLGTGKQLELADPVARLVARVIDWLLFWAIAFVVILFLAIRRGSPSSVGTIIVLFLMVAFVGLLYEPILIALRGQTVGKMAMKIRVARADNGSLPGWGKSIGRWAIPGLLVFIPFVGWLLALLCYISLTWDRSRQGWHDRGCQHGCRQGLRY